MCFVNNLFCHHRRTIDYNVLVGNIAVCTFALAVILVALAFSTSHWLFFVSEIIRSNVGLWQFCFSFIPNEEYTCHSIYYDDSKVATDLPNFMVLTQVMCIITSIILLSDFVIVTVYCKFKRTAKRWIEMVSLSIGVSLIVAAIFTASACTIFWSCYEGNVNVKRSRFEWSFYTAVVGAIVLFISGISFIVDYRLRVNVRQRGCSESHIKFSNESGLHFDESEN